jgi:hypothetical protein
MLVKARQDGSREIIPRLVQAYDCPRVLENRTRHLPVRAVEPYLCVFGSTTPAWLRQDFTMSDILGGFVNRFVFITGRRKPAIPEQPPEDFAALRRAHETLLAARDRHPGGHAFRLAKAAREVWDTWYRAEYDRDYTDPVLGTLSTRLHTNATKLAVIYATLEGTGEITEEQITAAIAFGNYQREVQARLFGGFGEGERGRLERRVTDTLRRHGPLPNWKLRQIIRNVTAEDLAKTLRNLGSVQDIRRVRVGKGEAWHLREHLDAKGKPRGNQGLRQGSRQGEKP